jgi:hypothetical protein
MRSPRPRRISHLSCLLSINYRQYLRFSTANEGSKPFTPNFSPSMPNFSDSPGFPTQQKRRSTGQGAKKPLDPQRPEKTWAPAGASGHELSRPKRVSWLPAYGMMSAMSIPVSCVGVKTHVFMDDLVVAHWTSDVESTAPLAFLLRHGLRTPLGCLMNCKNKVNNISGL